MKNMNETYRLADYLDKPISACTNLELLNGLMDLTTEAGDAKGFNTGKKKLYYISAEFLIGKLLSNNLINLGLYDQVKAELEAAGKNLAEIEELENEPSLGNGGLGRLAACFIDSCATLGLPADGIGLAYHCGLFRQNFEELKQSATPDTWLRWGTKGWMRRTNSSYSVEFGDLTLKSTMYEIMVTGYDSRCGRLRLFDVDSVDERIIKNSIHFDPEQVAKNLTLFLYPDDSTIEGKRLRIYQEYFMVSNGAQLMLDECIAKGSNLHDLADYAAVQINDTHPAMVIPELIRLLMGKGVSFEEASDIVTNVCGYTNHTILAEALETWPKDELTAVVPALMPIIEKLDAAAKKRSSEAFVSIIDENGRVHMANMAIHFSHSVNGVAKLHTDILVDTELAPFAKLYPQKFNNKTNGITFRRWLMECNPKLAALISDSIGEGWKKNAEELEKLQVFADDDDFLTKLIAIKRDNKQAFADWMKDHQKAEINPDSIFDVQSKRLHEYKRQQLNLLWAIRKLQEIRDGKVPATPVTVIFGAKAAPAYTIAQDIIHAILVLSKIVENDSMAKKYLNVVMIENYNVTAAQALIPACDISEQISLASKEASGTGNMKFMLNGAVTLGTMDGANVEIAGLVGKENIYTFGDSSDTVIARYKKGDYRPFDYVKKDPALKKAVEFLVSDEMKKTGDPVCLQRLYDELLGKDWFMTMPDFDDYCRTKEEILLAAADAKSYAKMALVNIAKAGFFSSDRTIEQYNDEIWHLEKDRS